jgi:hypothetical protein
MTEESTTLDPKDWIAEHVRLYLEDPEKAHMWDFTPVGGPGLLPTLLLTTTGRKSGKLRHLPLIYEHTKAGYDFVGIDNAHVQDSQFWRIFIGYPGNNRDRNNQRFRKDRPRIEP